MMGVWDFWEFEPFRNAFLASLILAPTCAVLGVFITSKGMSFFSDAIAHSALTGAALGYAINEWVGWDLSPQAAVLGFSLILASVMAHFFNRTQLRPDTVIAFSLTGSVALGYLILSQIRGGRSIESLLFGSVFNTKVADLWFEVGLAVGIFAFLSWHVRGLLLGIVQPDLARIQGVRLRRLNFVFAWVVAATVAACLNLLGVLLVSAFIVIPAAAARMVAGSFRQMIGLSAFLGTLGAGLGCWGSFQVDWPTGPCMVMAQILILLACGMVGGLRSS